MNQAYWFEQVASLDGSATTQEEAEASVEDTEVESEPEVEQEQQEAEKEPEQDPFVYINGKHKLSRQLYEIFLNESMQNLTLLEQDVASLTDGKTQAPEKKANHAIHTLASNALAAGFTPMGELCRALEGWLDEVSGNWDPEYIKLYSSVMKTVAKMWQSASELKMPRASKALIKKLIEATEKASEHKEAVDNLLYEDVQENNVVEEDPALDEPKNS